MSYGSAGSLSGLAGRVMAFFRPSSDKRQSEFAHPWSAYRPKPCLAARPPADTPSPTSANGVLIEKSAPTSASVSQTHPAAVVALSTTPLLPPPLPPAASIIPFLTRSEPTSQPVPAQKTTTADTEAPARTAVITALILPHGPMQPASSKSIHAQIEEAVTAAATSAASTVKSQDFRLAARLRSIAVLNRPVSASASASANRGQDRSHASTTTRTYRTLTIDPPAVLRDKPRNSATILRFVPDNRASERRNRPNKNVA